MSQTSGGVRLCVVEFGPTRLCGGQGEPFAGRGDRQPREDDALVLVGF